MRPLRFVLWLLPLCSPAAAQARPERQFSHGRLVSRADPSAVLEPAGAFRYAGGQVIDIFNVAGAEQHFFIDAGPDSTIRRFYWVQFEHYYPTNSNVYDYSRITQRPVRIGALDFMGDVRVIPDYFTFDARVGSDSKAAEQFLRARGLRVTGTYVTLRLFHLPDSSRRSELMMIYGELLLPGVSQDSVASGIVRHAQEQIRVRAPG